MVALRVDKMVDKMVYSSAVSLDGRRLDVKVATSVSSIDVQSAALSNGCGDGRSLG